MIIVRQRGTRFRPARARASAATTRSSRCARARSSSRGAARSASSRSPATRSNRPPQSAAEQRQPSFLVPRSRPHPCAGGPRRRRRPELPAREARAEGRARRRRRRPWRRRRRSWRAPSLRDLSSFRGRTWFSAGRGEPGRGARKHGADGETIELAVPVGTQVYGAEGDLIADLAQPDARVVLARGGGGGSGNARFATPTRQTPRFAEVGEPPEEEESSCGSSCWRTRRSPGCRTRASRRCCAASRMPSRRSPTTRSRRSRPCSGRSSRRTAPS